MSDAAGGAKPESFEIRFRELRCRLDKDDEHFLCEPRVLPCANSACLECIKRLRDENNCLKCHICNQEHKLEDLTELPSNQSIIDQIKLNSDEITEEIAERLKKYVESLNGKQEFLANVVQNFRFNLTFLFCVSFQKPFPVVTK